MPSFVVDGQEYELVSFDQLDDMTLDEVEILEEAGASLDSLTAGDVGVTTKLVKGLVLISMRRVNPEATVQDAGRVKLSVLSVLAESVANAEGDAVPPTAPAGSGSPA